MILEVNTSIEDIIQVQEELRSVIEKLTEDAPEVENLAPIVEQQPASDTYETTSYTIDIDYGEGTVKTYYESVTDAESTDNSASYTLISQYEQDTLHAAQEIATNTREGEQTNKPYCDSDLDMNLKHAKESVKFFSPATWFVMYEGKLTFN